MKRASWFWILRVIFLMMFNTEAMAQPSSPGTPVVLEAPVMEDPLESWNRFVFEVNNGLDTLIFFPILDVYSALIPKPLQTGVSNVVGNLWDPLRFVNFLLQGSPTKATTSLCRFVVNSVFGLFGLIDVAESMGIPREETDFGRTLQTWGSEPGFYIVWPLLGPGSVRDGLGLVVDTGIDPVNLLCFWKKKTGWLLTRTGAEFGVTKQKHLDSWRALQETSVDFYSAIRSLYGQNRNSPVGQGASESVADEGPLPSSFAKEKNQGSKR